MRDFIIRNRRKIINTLVVLSAMEITAMFVWGSMMNKFTNINIVVVDGIKYGETNLTSYAYLVMGCMVVWLITAVYATTRKW